MAKQLLERIANSGRTAPADVVNQLRSIASHYDLMPDHDDIAALADHYQTDQVITYAIFCAVVTGRNK